MGLRGQWITSPAADAALALSWIPFALAAHAVDGRAADLRWLLAAVMFVSFAHQPLTFPLVYASPWRRASHLRLFTWFPVIAAGTILVATRVSMTAVAVVGGLWNLEHILMQRYGLVRMYGRKAADDQGSVERWLLVTWFLVPLLWIAATGRLQRILDRLSSTSVDSQAARILARMSPEATAALVVAGGAALVLTLRWVSAERGLAGRTRANPAKWLYLGSTAALFAVAFVDPVAAVVGFIASHSIEYFVIVGRSVGSERGQEGRLGRWARRPHGLPTFFGLYALSAIAVFVLLYRVAPPGVLLVGSLTVGAVHFLYDALIWKLRRPQVAASLSIRSG